MSYIWPKPTFQVEPIGWFRAGSKLNRAEKPYEGTDAFGCGQGKWWAVEPYGYVCEGSYGVTLDVDDPRVVAAAKTLPHVEDPLPYGYGNSQGSWFYTRVPTKEDLKVEGDVEAWRKLVAEQRAKTEPAKLWPELAMPLEPMPSFLQEHKPVPPVLAWLVNNPSPNAGYAAPGTRLAFASAFESEGRSYYLTTEQLVVPADRFRAASLSPFHGVELAPAGQPGEHLPLAWSRLPGIPAHVYRIDGDEVTMTDSVLPYQAHAPIADESITVKGAKYHVLLATPSALALDPGHTYAVRDGEAIRVDAEKERPSGVDEDEVWIDVNLSKETLVIYDHLTPTFVTLISSGSGGKDHVTPWGHFRIYQKHLSSRMSAPEKPAENEGDEAQHAYRYDDVPWVQYVIGGIALHTAFWHDRFGVPVSHGCINLSPRDAQYVFGKTLPAIPAGWHAVYPGREPIARGTMVSIHG